jgi:transcription antitermination factor NusG
MFPRYLFIDHDRPDFWRPIRETQGVASVLTCGSRMQYANAGAVEAVQAAELLAATYPPDRQLFAPGALVTLANGSLSGHPAVVLDVSRDTARVSVLLFGALRQVTAPLDCLVARDGI